MLLERLGDSFGYNRITDFNSIKVRLELVSVSPTMLCSVNFNSIKVRLELPVAKQMMTYPRFQFHKGAIRTFSAVAVIAFILHFNSIKVRLELRPS